MAGLVLTLFSALAEAVDYRSIEPGAAILYDAPSFKGKKLYLIRAQTPVEVVVRLGEWQKIRDAEGTLAWIEAKNLVDRRSLMVTAAKGEIRQLDQPDAPILLEVGKGVGLEWVEAGAPGWAKVRHRDGVTGFIRQNQVWGL